MNGPRPCRHRPDAGSGARRTCCSSTCGRRGLYAPSTPQRARLAPAQRSVREGTMRNAQGEGEEGGELCGPARRRSDHAPRRHPAQRHDGSTLQRAKGLGGHLGRRELRGTRVRGHLGLRIVPVRAPVRSLVLGPRRLGLRRRRCRLLLRRLLLGGHGRLLVGRLLLVPLRLRAGASVGVWPIKEGGDGRRLSSARLQRACTQDTRICRV